MDRNMESFCEGAVIPYYEYRSPAILTDAEWREQFDRPDAVRMPDWAEMLFERQ